MWIHTGGLCLSSMIGGIWLASVSCMLHCLPKSKYLYDFICIIYLMFLAGFCAWRAGTTAVPRDERSSYNLPPIVHTLMCAA